jgi:hypothetical protein
VDKKGTLTIGKKQSNAKNEPKSLSFFLQSNGGKPYSPI